MCSFFVFVLTIALVLASIFGILIILMQRPTSNSGLGSSLGGGAAELAFGGETTNVLNKWTIYCTIFFFVASFALAMMHIGAHAKKPTQSLPAISQNAEKTSHDISM